MIIGIFSGGFSLLCFNFFLVIIFPLQQGHLLISTPVSLKSSSAVLSFAFFLILDTNTLRIYLHLFFYFSQNNNKVSVHDNKDILAKKEVCL